MTPARSYSTEHAVHQAIVVDERAEWLDAVGQTLIELGIEIVGKETSCSAALSCIDREQPDLLVVRAGEGTGGRGAGFECLRLIHQRQVQAPRAIVLAALQTTVRSMQRLQRVRQPASSRPLRSRTSFPRSAGSSPLRPRSGR
jgi:DNA-binding response OmpR family regulator